MKTPATGPVSLFWFRRDLRLDDNVGLEQALRSGRPVVPLFIFDTEILSRLEDQDDKRLGFIHKTVTELNQRLVALGSGLLIGHGEPVEIFRNLVQRYQIEGLYFNHDYEPYALERDQAVSSLLRGEGCQVRSFKDHVIFEKLEVTKDNSLPYTVFTPYAKKWKTRFESEKPKAARSEAYLQGFFRWPQRGRSEAGTDQVAKSPVFSRGPDLFHAGRKIISLEALGFSKEAGNFDFPALEIKQRLIANYDKTRNIPSILGTSRLGLHLRFGTMSVREAVHVAREQNETWLGELIWREFFIQIMANFPQVVSMPFRSEYGKIKWRHNEREFDKWKRGLTGYPIVDAGMRELLATGFMHNRVRMIAASFLVKHLLIDWKWGEAHFARYLLDFELASNNGNWQWVAGCGCDAAPYFRVFNPELQEKKFDPKQTYIQNWLPEYGSSRYPARMVDHVEARKRVLSAYAVGLGKKAPAFVPPE